MNSIKTAVPELNFHVCFIFTRMLIGDDAHVWLYDEFVNVIEAFTLCNDAWTRYFIREIISSGLQEYMLMILTIIILLFFI